LATAGQKNHGVFIHHVAAVASVLLRSVQSILFLEINVSLFNSPIALKIIPHPTDSEP